MKEFYIDSDGTRLHAKLDCPEGVKKGPLCILIHGFTGDMEEEHLIAARDAMMEAGVAVLRAEMYGHGGRCRVQTGDRAKIRQPCHVRRQRFQRCSHV